uniref:Uncharacterized protein n=1 Tax=Utricularia reniformis TaxID=192314 RepID=A0A1Y0B0Q2_9LAMI|nr:hypothetical protein AEK19_MT0736 [Utricularia reniformis]ART30980.1 hypothetical protein AEK19_MT0736 [Utricularia reniformis]
MIIFMGGRSRFPLFTGYYSSFLAPWYYSETANISSLNRSLLSLDCSFSSLCIKSVSPGRAHCQMLQFPFCQ